MAAQVLSSYRTKGRNLYVADSAFLTSSSSLSLSLSLSLLLPHSCLYLSSPCLFLPFSLKHTLSPSFSLFFNTHSLSLFLSLFPPPPSPIHSPNEAATVGAEGGLSEEGSHELVLVDDVYLSSHCSSVSSQHLTPCHKLLPRPLQCFIQTFYQGGGGANY